MAVWRKSGFMYVCVGLARRRLGTLQQILFLFVFFFLTFLSLEYGGAGGGGGGGGMLGGGRGYGGAGAAGLLGGIHFHFPLFPLSHQGIGG